MPMLSPDLLLAYTAFLVGVASPGPSTLAVMGTAMAQGRRQALALSAGVVSGSLFWGLCAAFGLAAAMQRYGSALLLVKIAGGLYLLWLAWQAARRALRTGPAAMRPSAEQPQGSGTTYLRGLAMHLTNPKSVFVWLSVVSLAMPAGARVPDTLAFVGSCVCISATVFCCYALAFSTAAARRGYQASERWVNAGLAGVFAWAGVRMLWGSQAR